jgi:hypothetical protein
LENDRVKRSMVSRSPPLSLPRPSCEATIWTGDITPGLKERSRTATASPDGFSESAAMPRSIPTLRPRVGSAKRISSAAAGIANHGWASTVRAHRSQPLGPRGASSYALAGRKRLGRLQVLTRSPRAASSAGSIVQAVRSVQTTTSTAPSAIPLKSGELTRNSEKSEMITMVPEKAIVRPLVVIAMPTALTTGSAFLSSCARTSSSRKRVRMKSE